ncbi:MAG: NAD(P)H-dependent oxidoreductase [Candidatus Omnitrophica bacterium]|nr:NAD(P)H-dependent oxidoreductase [Candidatus Omnitrophota bacterium]
MKILILLAHPSPGSFNHAITDAVRAALEAKAHTVIVHDLYAERFDPMLPGEEIPKTAALDPVVQRHIRELSEAEGVVVVHPNWWGQPPAVLKGWMDRVLRQGTAYTFGRNDKGEGVVIGLLKAHAAVVFTTANTPQDAEDRLYGDPLDGLWKKCVFGFCGVSRVIRKNFTSVIMSTDEVRRAWLDEARQTVAEAFRG